MHVGGEGVAGKDHGSHVHPQGCLAWPKVVHGLPAMCKRAILVAQRAGGEAMAAIAGCLKREGAAHDGEGSVVHGRDRGGSKDE